MEASHLHIRNVYLLIIFREGVNFVSVHDCFWTHVCDIETMNKACRTQFVALHGSPLLEELSEFMVNKYVVPLE